MPEKAASVFRRLLTVKSDKKRRILIGIGLIGIALIALSEWLPSRRAPTATAQQMVEASEIEAALEKRITNMLTGVAGVGNCRVMVTLEQGSRFVYAGEKSQTGEKTLLVETDSGAVGLLLTEIQPTVRGVAVVCRGGGDPAVRENVISLITTAFHLSSGRVWVARSE